MGTSVQVKPLCGVYNENPLSYLVSVDGFNFLIDCGWNDHFDTSLLQPLSRVASTVDAVLLSYPDTLHLGALPYAMKHFGLAAPVYATEPVYRLGLLTMYDQYLSRKQVSDFDLFTLDDIDFAFQSVTRLTYSQNYHMSGKGEGVVIAPHVSGHLLGGTVWKITKDGEDVIYAVDFNHRKERLLNGTILESFVRPAVLITDAYNALSNQPSRCQRDQEFLGNQESVRERTLMEEHARDSFENLLFSVCWFREFTGSYPQNITVVGYDFKNERFEHLHRTAIRFPETRFFYSGTPSSPTSREAALKGEAFVRTQFEDDPYGCKGSLSRKKLGRDPFHRTIPYPNGCPEIEGLFRYCGTAPYPGSLPWAQ